jgi:hypothetical protein
VVVDITQIQKNSEKFNKYINNLDKLLGVTTVVKPAVKGLRLTKDKRLLIDSQHDWYVYDKDPNEPIFTVVGIGISSNTAIAYLLGNHNDSSPFLTKLDTLSLDIDGWNQRVVRKSDRAKRWPLNKSLKIGGFSLAGIAGVVGIGFLVNWMMQGATQVANTATTAVTSTPVSEVAPAGLTALINVLPFVFVAIILLSAVAWVGKQGKMPFTTLLQQLADAFGISVGFLGISLFVLIGIMVGISAYTMTGNILLSLIGIGGVLFGGAFFGILPIWIPFIYSIMAVSTVLFSHFEIGLGDKHSLPDAKAVMKSVKEDIRQMLVINIEQHSKNLSQYTNNLDTLLGIKTVNQPSVKGLELTKSNELLIGGVYDWYLYEKHPAMDVFKVAGLRKGSSKPLVYMLGQKEGTPFLAKAPVELLNGKFDTGDTVELVTK